MKKSVLGSLSGSLCVLCVGLLLTGCSSRRQELFLSGSETESQVQIETMLPGQESQVQNSVQTDEKESTREAQQNYIFVDVCGAVKKPGVYELALESRVFEAIERAGGFTEDAAAWSVNQAQPLTDGQQLYVPALSEVEEQGRKNVLAGSVAEGQKSDKININTADKQELMTLNGIGETRAEAILSYREEHGLFSSVEDLLQVPGIKEGTLAKIRDRIVA